MISNKMEIAGTQLSLAKGIRRLVTLYTGSVIFTKAFSIILFLLPKIMARINLPMIIHIRNERV